MSNPHIALYVDEDAKFSARSDIKHEDIADNELLVEVHYSGVNPADARHATSLGIRSTVIGYDFAGRVLKASSTSKFKTGDIIAGYTPSGIGRPLKYGTHQDQLAVPDDMVFSVPENLPESHAAALTVVTMTAADVLYSLFKFPLPTDPGTFESPIFIWGATTGVGIAVLQFARASGCKNIIVTASPARFDLVKSLGATHVFDYASPTITADIIAATKEIGQGPITHALDAVGTMVEPFSSDQVLQCVDEITKLVFVVLARSERFKIPFAIPKDGWKIHPVGAPEPISIPSRPEDHWNSWKALHWAIDNYGTRFQLPPVEVIKVAPEQALEEIHKVAEGKRGFGKLVIGRPFK
ncbi:hypothetical protein NW762_006352 [Fusarium torreyae]|uniref:Enoyl reductase (ER) domain-containing protein n=1 Tax=Fusarium torreyae TaxID=1237075 RepID=A0A9W8S2F5_9HYPO|nr:hypothetical protein NW762_006352 [Fusarium torreyae]